MAAAGQLVTITEPPRVALRLPRAEVPAAIHALRAVARHAEVLELLAKEDGPIWIGWVYAQTSATAKTLKDLAKVGAIAFDEARRWRDPLEGKTFTLDQPPPLTPEQAALMETILPALKQPGKPFLLHGVTGSGKTEIYLQTIARVLQQGRGVLFLVPEIMLATQIVQRVQARFPGKVAVWHSALSPGERFDTWERVRAGELPIVVGPRSALFAPLRNPGLIVVDEEHEPAYKQDRTPPFHARDAAVQYARLCNIPILMGSATPDVVSYRKAQRGEYHLLELPNRILAHKKHLAVQAALLKRRRKGDLTLPPAAGDAPVVALPMPPVEIVDLREELKAGNRSIFSRALSAAIEKTLAAGEQVILFLNRRGTATFVICRDCGYVSQCPRCDTTLTYHAPGEQLACHYCGHRQSVPAACPDCGSERIRYFGLGTERVEAVLRRTFPQARPIRLDRDTTRRRDSHYTFLQHFAEGRANVMIGTQMVAKGLDLPLVTLVGVISADTALYLPDFRAAERTFQVLMQVAGRAGRSPLGGRVIVQTYTPEQPAILAAAAHDYRAFYDDELRFRYEQGYPPFKRLARLTFSGSGREESEAAARALADRLRLWVDRQGFPAVEIIGPAPTYVPRIGSRYRWQILL
ncbi:MAG: primosomal protein N', partial [Caldilineae bacterium]